MRTPFLGLIAGLALGVVWLLPGGGDSQEASQEALRAQRAGCTWQAILTSRTPRWPACRRPFDADSPFNQVLGPTPRLAADSTANSAWLGNFDISSLVFGDPARDGGVPVYRSRRGDPLYRLHCYMEEWGTCELEGKFVRIPSAAKPAGVWPNPQTPTDGHLTVVDPSSRWEYDLWAVRSKPRRGGVLSFAWGGRTKIDGDGLDSAAVAARTASLAGTVRAHELVSGRIDHALALVVPCTHGKVFPASGRSISCAEVGMPGHGAPPLGARFQLPLSDAEIAVLPVPEWQRPILRALARYGGFVTDTTSQDYWGIEYESGASFSSFGQPDPRIAWSRSLGSPAEDFNENGELEYWLHFSDAIDWGRMRVIAPCFSRGTCD